MLACRVEVLCRHVLCHAAMISQTRFDKRIGSARKESADDGKESGDDGKAQSMRIRDGVMINEARIEQK